MDGPKPVRTMKPANAHAEVAAPGRRQSRRADRPVFVAEHRRRERAVRAALVLLGALLLVWLVALIAGALGLGSLPPLPVSGGGDGGSGSSSPSATPPPSVRAATDNDAAATGPAAAGLPEGHSGSAVTRHPAQPSQDVPTGVVANAGVGSHPGATKEPAASGGQGEPAIAPPGSQQAAGKGNAGGNGGPRSAEAPSQPVVAHGPPAVTPSGNEVPSGGGGAPGTNAEEGAGAAHRAAETGPTG
jgi:hypothetical protein